MPKGLMLTDLAIAGLLLILAKVIRVHTPLLQRMYIPSAVLAGLFGLIFGPALLDILPWTDTFTANASLLTAALFSALGLATEFHHLKPSHSALAHCGHSTKSLLFHSGYLQQCLVLRSLPSSGQRLIPALV